MVALDSPIRVLLVDDEEIVRYGLKMLAQCDPNITVVGEAGNGESAIEQAMDLKPDVVLMDIAMPGMDGITAMQAIQQQLNTKVLILTTHDDDQHLIEAVQQGALGYLLKNTPPEDFGQIIQSAAKGYLQIGPSLAAKLTRQLQFPSIQQRAEQIEEVTPREQEVIQLVARGATNREIAKFLHITEKTVKNHVSSILNRLNLRDRTQLAIWANTGNTPIPA